jgi:hypothetical protein
MILGSCAHIIREVSGRADVSSEEQIEAARRADGGHLVDVFGASEDGSFDAGKCLQVAR